MPLEMLHSHTFLHMDEVRLFNTTPRYVCHYEVLLSNTLQLNATPRYAIMRCCYHTHNNLHLIIHEMLLPLSHQMLLPYPIPLCHYQQMRAIKKLSDFRIDSGYKNKNNGFYPKCLQSFLRILCVVDDYAYSYRRSFSALREDAFGALAPLHSQSFVSTLWFNFC